LAGRMARRDRPGYRCDRVTDSPGCVVVRDPTRLRHRRSRRAIAPYTPSDRASVA
jgi:hypothetical protein